LLHSILQKQESLPAAPAAAVVVAAGAAEVAGVVEAAVAVVDKRQHAFNEPFFLQWHLTDRCNLVCQHCYRDENKKDLDLDTQQLILNQFCSFLQAIGRDGRIHFSGGEPYLSAHLFDLIQTARVHNLPSRILSNGTLITPELAARTRQAGCRLVQVSLDGLEPTHDKIRGKGTFKRALAGIANLRAAGIEVTIAMTLSRVNLHDALPVARLAEQIADRVHFSRLVPVGAGEALEADLLTQAEIYRLLSDLHAFHGRTQIDFPLRDPLWKAYFNPQCSDCATCISGCAVGYNGLCIESNGDVYPCRRLPIVIGNVLIQSLNEIWHAPLMQALRDRDQLQGNCGDCRLRWVCGGCRGVAYGLCNDPLAEDPQCFRRPSRIAEIGRQLAARFSLGN
jgi:radical SAM protein with 4Fe4S-binding SPASM domain